MAQGVEVEERHVTSIEVDGRRYVVSVAITFDGVEHVGKLWYHEESFLDDEGIRDRSAIPGRTADEVTTRARALSASELTLRLRRAWAEQRRHHDRSGRAPLRRLGGDHLRRRRAHREAVVSRGIVPR